VASNVVELVCERPAGSFAAQAIEAVDECASHGFRLRFTRQTGNLPSEAFGFSISDIQCHVTYV
jgi:hypothetical protein